MELQCPYCGGAISFSDRTCPYCGKVNDKAAAHISEKARYDIAYQETAQMARVSIFRNRKIRTYAILLAVLLFGILCNLFARFAAYGFYTSYLETQAGAKTSTYLPMLDQALAEEDFLKFHALFYRYRLRFANDSDSYEPYYILYDLSKDYACLTEYIMRAALKRPPEEDPFATDTSLLNSDILGEYTRSYFDLHDPKDYAENHYRFYNIDVPMTIQYMEKMDAQLDALFVTYFGFTGEDLQMLRTASKEDIAVLIEERYDETHE